jgi:hypothetical protein
LSYTYYFQPKDYYPEQMLIRHIKQNLVPGARVLDVQNILFGQTAIAYDIPSMTNHWFTQPGLRALVHQLSTDVPSKGLTLETIHSIDDKHAWPILRRMHVQFVSLPYAGNQAWIDASKNNDWRVVEKDEKGIALLEVLYDGQSLQGRGLSGEGYSDYLEHAGRISFRPATQERSVTIPVRMHDGWNVTKGAIAIAASPNHLINVFPNNSAERVELEYFPRHFYFWLTIGPLALLIFSLSLKYSERR